MFCRAGWQPAADCQIGLSKFPACWTKFKPINVAQTGFAANGRYVIFGAADHLFRGLPGKMTDDKKRSSVPLEIVAAGKETKI
jgi:hypothetical protein